MDEETKIGQASLKVTVLDSETLKPIKGIPVSCSQPNSKWDANALVTDENGEVEFDGLLEGEFARISGNYGGYFHYLQGEQSSLPIFPQASGLNHRTIYLKKGETVHTVSSAPQNMAEA